MKHLHAPLALCLSLSLVAACGDDDDDDATPDAGASADAAANPDAALAVCAEFDAPAGTIDTVPGTFSGDTSGAGADLEVAEGVCTTELSYYAQAGDDQVVALTGLTGGTDYAVKVTSAADLSMYVATGCTGGGPGAGECLLFVDEGLAGSEVGAFAAPSGGDVFVVVDQFGTDPVADGSYTLEVYESECDDSGDCSGATPNCFEHLCVACVTAFDCESSAAPACGPDNECIAGFDQCTGDDAAESDDDGPAGATPLDAPTAGTPTTYDGAICSAPATEADYFSFTVADGDSRVIALSWTGDEDLDLILFDADGNDLDFAFFDQPEVIRADDMTAGTYYVSVTQYAPANTAAAVAYTLSLSIPECDSSFDCADAGSPFCDATSTCTTGPSDCVGDDGGEDGDDGPAGATDVTPAIDGMTTTNASICNAPGTERDFYKVVVADGDDVSVQLSWTDAAADLDITTNLADGVVSGITFWQDPETVALTNLPAGTHYIQISYFAAAPTTTVADYTLTVARSAGGCSTVADCAAEYETQLFRGNCAGSGACELIDGAGALADGALCDSPDDCTSGMCSYVLFESDADASVCTVSCSEDADCDGALGAGYKCTVPFSTNFCHPTCTDDTDCGANINSDTLDTDLPWDYLTCNAGACEL